jgi:hypothetical protein
MLPRCSRFFSLVLQQSCKLRAEATSKLRLTLTRRAGSVRLRCGSLCYCCWVAYCSAHGLLAFAPLFPILFAQESVHTFLRRGQTEFTKLVPNLVGVDPDDAFSTVPYEKGFCLLQYLQTLVSPSEVYRCSCSILVCAVCTANVLCVTFALCIVRILLVLSSLICRSARARLKRTCTTTFKHSSTRASRLGTSSGTRARTSVKAVTRCLGFLIRANLCTREHPVPYLLHFPPQLA